MSISSAGHRAKSRNRVGRTTGRVLRDIRRLTYGECRERRLVVQRSVLFQRTTRDERVRRAPIFLNRGFALLCGPGLQRGYHNGRGEALRRLCCFARATRS